jgi:hypothetical protein
MSSNPRSLRGGSWLNFPRLCRSVCRSNHLPIIRNDRIGFRIIAPMTPPPSPPSAKLLRGGSWEYSPGGCRSAWRNAVQDGRYNSLGFRVCCLPQENTCSEHALPLAIMPFALSAQLNALVQAYGDAPLKELVFNAIMHWADLHDNAATANDGDPAATATIKRDTKRLRTAASLVFAVDGLMPDAAWKQAIKDDLARQILAMEKEA